MRVISSLMLLLGAMQLGAQAPAMRALDLTAPVRVRVTIPELSVHRFVGRVEHADVTRLQIALTDGGTGLVVPWSKATLVERSIGRNRTGAATTGLAIGAAAGAGIYAWQIGYARRTVESEQRPAAFAANAALGAILGSLFLGGKGWVSVPVRGLRPVAF